MTLVDRESAGFAPFQLRGEVDVASIAAFRNALTAYATSEGDIVCDCAELGFLDSAAIAVLVAMRHRLEELGRTLLLVNVDGSPRRALQAAGLLDFNID
jgi:anti-anti-sigma factor